MHTSAGTSGAENRTGPVWNMGIEELKELLSTPGAVENHGLSWQDIARRACAEYENFAPQVQSFHDYTTVTFWFLGGFKQPSSGGGVSFFGPGGVGP